MTTTTEKSKTFGKISTINTKADQGKDQTMAGAAGHQKGQASSGIEITTSGVGRLVFKPGSDRQEAEVQRKRPPGIKEETCH